MKKIIFSALFICVIFNSISQTVISDGDNVSGTWTPMNSPYIIEGEATIFEGDVLTILSGVTVKFNTGTNYDYSSPDFDLGILIVEGSLVAVATEEYPINFTRDGDSGNWANIFFKSSLGSYISNCNFEYGHIIDNIDGLDWAYGVVSLNSSYVNCSNSNFTNNQGVAIACYSSHSNFYNNIVNNNTFGMYSVQEESSNFANNFSDKIE